jgi:hypothetical protein
MVNGNLPVCIPNATAIPRMATNTTNGTMPAGGGPFLLSVTANTTINRINVPMNWAPLIGQLVFRCWETHLVKETVCRRHVVKLRDT